MADGAGRPPSAATPAIRFGVIGAGEIGRLRAAALSRTPGTQLLAVADVDRGRAEAAARASGAAALIEWRHLVDAYPVDAVVVSTPTHHHEEIAVAALGAGKHVLCEKPLSNGVESCRRIVAAARRSGRVLGVGFNHRYFPPFRRLKRLIDAGEIGRLDHLRLFGGHDGIRNFRADWMYRSALSGGGAMMDIGIHLTDLCAFLAGEVVGVRAVLGERTCGIEGSEDNAMAILETAAGVPAIYQATWSEWRGYRFSVEAHGDLGMARASIAPMTSLVVKRSGARRYGLYPWLNLREKIGGWQTLARDSFAAEIRDFIGAIRGDENGFADGEAGLRAVEVAAAARESSRSGDTVRLGPLARPDVRRADRGVSGVRSVLQ